MKTKIIPFDLETAKKIQTGEIEGKIKNKRGDLVRLICTDLKGAKRPIVDAVDLSGEESVFCHTITGEYVVNDNGCKWNLVLEVPDKEPNEPQFKPFDRVLVRANNSESWIPRFYSRKCQKIGHWAQDGDMYEQCIPYEGNEDLVGTTNMPKED